MMEQKAPVVLRMQIHNVMELIKSPCEIARSFGPDHSEVGRTKGKFVAMWDTGSNISVVSQRVIQVCGLEQEGELNDITHLGGTVRNKPAYFVKLILPKGIEFPRVQVTSGICNGFDVLIGVDIIRHGDFLILNGGGKTEALFRYPSVNDSGLGMISADNTSARRNRSRTSRRRSQLQGR